jgi:hypothetical protein
MFEERIVNPLSQDSSEAERKAAGRLGRERVKQVRVGALARLAFRTVPVTPGLRRSVRVGRKYPHIHEEVADRDGVQA